MRTDTLTRPVPKSPARPRIVRALIRGALLAVMSPLAWAHSDPSMFGQAARTPAGPVSTSASANPSAGALATATEVKLPPRVRERESDLFSLAQANAGNQASEIRTYGQVVPNTHAVVDVNTYISGQVVEVFVRLGDSVRKGDAIMSVFNPEFITTQKGYLEFLKNEEKLQVLREEGRLPNYLKDAKENLRWWGMSDREINDLIEHAKVVEHIVLQAPTAGFVTDMFVQPGSLVNAGDRTMKQFVVVGKAVARMVSASSPYWIEAYVYPDQRALLRPGMPARIGLPAGRSLERPIAQVLPMVDAQTQRARFLIDLGRVIPGLAVGQSVEVDLQLKSGSGTWVPRQAVLGQAISPVVFVRTAPGRYLRKPVAILAESGTSLQVKGVDAGEQVVVAGKMMLEGLYRISAGPGASAGDHHHDDHHH